ncbi:MAG: hypothetical protein HKN14_14660 [Marinicaulis sp.]|nr:hypothetical protein [Marinicaulis sp.]
MSMIIVSSAQHTKSALERYDPGFVISLVDENEFEREHFDRFRPDKFLQLTLDCSARNFDEKVEKAVRSIVEVARAGEYGKNASAPILIHCHEGVSRSIAAAYIFLCAVKNDSCEKQLIQRIRDAAPHADPNIMMVAAADKLLERSDRMVEAVLDLTPCSAGAVDEAVALQVNA